jgi:hypothetical protein
VSPADMTLVASHPGITYGGVLHQGALRGDAMIEGLAATTRLLADGGARRLLYKAVPHCYHRAPAEDDLYALFRAGARRVRCDLSVAIDLQHRLGVSERRRRAARKATGAGVEVRRGLALAPALWQVLEENLQRKHGVRPVHTLAEIEHLGSLFPSEIEFVGACRGEAVVAGVVLFRAGPAVHAQYIGSSEAGHAVSAIDLVFENSIAQASAAGARWFDFGISTEDQGRSLNDGLYRFKSEFGGAGIVHEFYELEL